MADEYIDKVEVGAKIQMMYIRREMDYGGENDFCRGMRKALRVIENMPAADVQPMKKSKWCPPLMGQGKCDTYCERCHGKIMRNSTGIFEETPFCPHCGARMDGEQNDT